MVYCVAEIVWLLLKYLLTFICNYLAMVGGRFCHGISGYLTQRGHFFISFDLHAADLYTRIRSFYYLYQPSVYQINLLNYMNAVLFNGTSNRSRPRKCKSELSSILLYQSMIGGILIIYRYIRLVICKNVLEVYKQSPLI